MHALDHLDEMKWEQPDSYGGFSPVGDYLVVTRTRDSSCRENSNYEVAFKCLRTVAEPFGEPPEGEREHIYYGWGGEGNDNQWVYDFRASHWACGWVEYLLVRADAPDEILAEAAEIFTSLKEYPVLDECDVSDRETEAAMNYWKGLPLRWRLDEWKSTYEHMGNPDTSYFVIRHDDAPMRDDNLFDRLREGL